MSIGHWSKANRAIDGSLVNYLILSLIHQSKLRVVHRNNRVVQKKKMYKNLKKTMSERCGGWFGKCLLYDISLLPH